MFLIKKPAGKAMIVLMPASPNLKQTRFAAKDGFGNVNFFNRFSPMSEELVRNVADLNFRWWSKKDDKKIEYYSEQAKRRNDISTHTIVVLDDNGTVGATMYPITLKGRKLSDVPRTWERVAGISSKGMWTTDAPNGGIVACPQIAADMRGSSKIIIMEAVQPQAARRYAMGEINHAIAYTRPSAYGSLKEKLRIRNYVLEVLENKHPAEFALNMHIHNGAKFVRFDKYGCPADSGAGGWNIVADYTPKIIENIFSLLDKMDGIRIIELDNYAGGRIYKDKDSGAEYILGRRMGNVYFYYQAA